MEIGTRFKKLKKEQREALLTWIADGLTPKEIRRRAAGFSPPFRPTSQHIYYYRLDRGIALEELEADLVTKARSAGFAFKGFPRPGRARKIDGN